MRRASEASALSWSSVQRIGNRMQSFQAWQTYAFKFAWFELDQSAGIDASTDRAAVAAQMAHNHAELGVGEMVARIQTVGDIQMPDADAIADERRCPAR